MLSVLKKHINTKGIKLVKRDEKLLTDDFCNAYKIEFTVFSTKLIDIPEKSTITEFFRHTLLITVLDILSNELISSTQIKIVPIT